MDEPDNLPTGNKWHVRLAILFLTLFAIFWSLGSFFFWVLFGLSAYFVFLAIYSSGLKINLFEQRRMPENPYRSYEPNAGQPTPSPQILTLRRVIRIFL